LIFLNTNSFNNLQRIEIEGYIFLGWYLDLNFQFEFSLNTKVSKNTMLYPKFYKISENMFKLEIDIENNIAYINDRLQFHRFYNPFKLIFTTYESGYYNFIYGVTTFDIDIYDENGSKIGFFDPYEYYFATLEKGEIYYIHIKSTRDFWFNPSFEIFIVEN
jgi:hypothetical protein